MQTQPVLKDENGVQTQMLGDNYFGGSPIYVDSAHYEIHCGDMVSLCYVVDLPNGADADIHFIVPNNATAGNRYHFNIETTAESEFDYKLYEGITTSANGTPVSAYNRNRQDPVVAENDVLYYHTPTVTGTGTLIDCGHYGSGKSSGGEARSSNEWVLKNNTKYLIRVNNATATANHTTIKISYYVHPGV